LSNAAGADIADLEILIAKQARLNQRLLLLFILPFLITVAMVAMFYTINSRLVSVEAATKLTEIERILENDKNYAWAIGQYEQLEKTYSNAQILSRLGSLYFLQDTKSESKAIETLERARRLDPEAWDIYRNLTYIYVVGDKPKEALDAGLKALNLNQTDANTFNNLAWIYSTSSNPAFVDLNKAYDHAKKAGRSDQGKTSQLSGYARRSSISPRRPRWRDRFSPSRQGRGRRRARLPKCDRGALSAPLSQQRQVIMHSGGETMTRVTLLVSFGLLMTVYFCCFAIAGPNPP
jgi:tetratricopeptide (TPR) repeat protein